MDWLLDIFKPQEPPSSPFPIFNLLWITSGVFALAACSITISQIATHLDNFHWPTVQRKVVGMLWIVPIYAIQSWISLGVVQASMYLDLIRDTYEAFVLYQFFAFCVTLVCERFPAYQGRGDPARLHDVFKQSGKDLHWFLKCKRGVLQYVLVKPLSAILAMAFSSIGYYEEGVFTFKGFNMYPAVALCVTASAWVAVFNLAQFYLVIRHSLANFSPGGKFLCIKMLVFVTYWQSVLFGVLVHFDVIEEFRIGFIDFKHTSTQSLAVIMQEALICLEMFLFSILHRSVFGYSQFVILPSEDSYLPGPSTPSLRNEWYYQPLPTSHIASETLPPSHRRPVLTRRPSNDPVVSAYLRGATDPQSALPASSVPPRDLSGQSINNQFRLPKHEYGLRDAIGFKDTFHDLRLLFRSNPSTATILNLPHYRHGLPHWASPPNKHLSTITEILQPIGDIRSIPISISQPVMESSISPAQSVPSLVAIRRHSVEVSMRGQGRDEQLYEGVPDEVSEDSALTDRLNSVKFEPDYNMLQ